MKSIASLRPFTSEIEGVVKVLEPVASKYINVEKELVTEYGITAMFLKVTPSETKTEYLLVGKTIFTTQCPGSHNSDYQIVEAVSPQTFAFLQVIYGSTNSVRAILEKGIYNEPFPEFWRNALIHILEWDIVPVEVINGRASVMVRPYHYLEKIIEKQHFDELVILYRETFGVLNVDERILKQFAKVCGALSFWNQYGDFNKDTVNK